MADIFDKLYSIQEEIKTIARTKKWGFWKYVPLEDLWAHIKPFLTKHKLLSYHVVSDNVVRTFVRDMEAQEGEYVQVESSFALEATDPQKKGSAISYGKRYNLGCIFNIITDEDNDADNKSNKLIQWPNVAKVKDIFKTKYWVTTAPEFRKKTKEVLGIERVYATYDESMAKDDLLKLLT